MKFLIFLLRHVSNNIPRLFVKFYVHWCMYWNIIVIFHFLGVSQFPGSDNILLHRSQGAMHLLYWGLPTLIAVIIVFVYPMEGIAHSVRSLFFWDFNESDDYCWMNDMYAADAVPILGPILYKCVCNFVKMERWSQWRSYIHLLSRQHSIITVSLMHIIASISALILIWVDFCCPCRDSLQSF